MTEMFNNNADKGAVEERVSRAADDKNGGTLSIGEIKRVSLAYFTSF